MREIRFRGVAVATGEIVYGDLIQRDGQVLVQMHDGARTEHAVISASVQQLINRDKNGAEVYEGDTLKNPRDDTIFKARFNQINTMSAYEKLGENYVIQGSLW